MNILIFSLQNHFHENNKADILSSVLSRLSKVSDYLSASLSNIPCSGRKFGVKYRLKVEIIIDESVNCGSLNQQIVT